MNEIVSDFLKGIENGHKRMEDAALPMVYVSNRPLPSSWAVAHPISEVSDIEDRSRMRRVLSFREAEPNADSTAFAADMVLGIIRKDSLDWSRALLDVPCFMVEPLSHKLRSDFILPIFPCWYWAEGNPVLAWIGETVMNQTVLGS